LSFFRPQSFLSKRFLICLRHPLPVENICYDVKDDLSYTFVNNDSKWNSSPNKNYSNLCLYHDITAPSTLYINQSNVICVVFEYIKMEYLWFPQCFCTGLT
jgi:hypothetical protein